VTPEPAGRALTTAAEATVVGLARLGDSLAFAELVRRRQAATHGLLRRLCKSAALADDLAQETFFQAWRQIGGLRAVGAFGGWLRQIAVNTWLQHLRAHAPDQLPHTDPPAPHTSAVEQVDLDYALNALQPAVRLCIVLNYHEGLSHGEIAIATALPLGTVKSHITRGTVQLRELLQAYEPPNTRQRTCA
jgi:RNA polymerase sigma-70 factor, ECF subfamily